MMLKFCDYCKTTYPYNGECPNKCKKKRKKENDSYYNLNQRANTSFYDSKEWRLTRVTALNRYHGLCIWTSIKHKRAERATMVHHIVEVRDDKSLALDMDNLIPMSESAHREIHALYRVDKKGTQEELRKIKEIHEKKLREEGIS